MPPVILAVADVVDGQLTRLSTEVATLARGLAAEAGGVAVGLVVAASPDAAAAELAGYVGRVISVAQPAMADTVPAPFVLAEVRRLVDEGAGVIVAGATTDGRDVLGALVAFTGFGYLANADAVAWADGAPVMTSTVLGGKAVVRSTSSTAGTAITVRAAAITADAAAVPGTVEQRAPATGPAVPAAVVRERVAEAGAQVSLEEARIVVVGGRGVGGPEGFDLVGDVADALGGVVGASRAAVDAGWIPYARQVGQTGRIVKPALYLGLGVSGAMQHRVGMQRSETIVCVNRDPDAPMAEIADLFVVADLFEVGPALAAEVRARKGA